jgi:hypothetical protein
MDDNVAGTVHLHTSEKLDEEKTTVIAQHNEIVHRTATGDVYVTRNGVELIPTPSTDPNDPLVCTEIEALTCVRSLTQIW